MSSNQNSFGPGMQGRPTQDQLEEAAEIADEGNPDQASEMLQDEVEEDLQDSGTDSSDAVGSPGPRERERARQEIDDDPVTGGSGDDGGTDGGTSDTSMDDPTDDFEPVTEDRPTQDQLEEAAELADEGQRQQASEMLQETVESGDRETGLEDTTGPGADRAQELEQQAIDQIDAATMPDDVVVSRQDGQIVAELTEQRQQEIRQGQRIRAEVSLERRLSEQLGMDVQAGEDFTVEAEQTDEGVRYSTELTDEFVAQQQPDQPASTGIPEGEYSGVDADAGTDQLPGRRDRDIFSGFVSTVEELSSRRAAAYGQDTAPEDTTPGQGSVVNVARRQAAEGTPDLTADLGPVSQAGDYLAWEAENIREGIVEPSAETVGEGLSTDVGARAVKGTLRVFPATAPGVMAYDTIRSARAVADDDIESLSEPGVDSETRRQFGEGTVSGGLGIANVPAVGATVVQGAEFAVRGGQRTAAGEGGEFAAEAGGQAALVGAGATRSAAENPARTAGQLAGGAAVSGGSIGAARAVGGAGTGRAASYAVQPGEELALTAARRGVPGARRVAGVVSDVEVDRRSGESLLGDERGMARAPQITITRSAESDVDADIDADAGVEPAEAQIPPRSEFASREEYARELERAQAREQLPPREEFPSQEAYAQELEMARQRVRGEDPFETTQTAEATQDVELSETRVEQLLRTETAGQFDDTMSAEAGAVVDPTATRQTAVSVTGTDTAETTATTTTTDTTQPTVATTDLETELETETTTEVATETGTRTDTRTETRTDTRTEMRADLRSESRRETGADDEWLDGDALTGAEATDDSEVVTREFEYGVADPEDVLSGDVL